MLKTVMKKYFSFEIWHIQEKKTFLLIVKIALNACARWPSRRDVHEPIMCPERSFAGGLALAGCTERSRQPAATCWRCADSGRPVLPFCCSVCNSREGRAGSKTSLGCRTCREKNIRVSQRSQLEEGRRRLSEFRVLHSLFSFLDREQV